MIPSEHVLVPVGVRGFCVRALRIHQVQQGQGVFHPEHGQRFALTDLHDTKGQRLDPVLLDVQCLVEPDAVTPCRQIVLMDKEGKPMTLSLGIFLAAGPQLVDNM